MIIVSRFVFADSEFNSVPVVGDVITVCDVGFTPKIGTTRENRLGFSVCFRIRLAAEGSWDAWRLNLGDMMGCLGMPASSDWRVRVLNLA